MYKRKTIFFIAFLIILVSSSHLLIRNYNAKYDNKKYTKYETYTVQPGDNLWLIADKYEHDDIREFIYEIEELSNVSALLRVGEELKIPIYEGR